MDRTTRAIQRASRSARRDNSYLEAKYLGQVELSAKTLGKNKIINVDATNPVVDKYKVLRTRVLQLMRENDWNIIGVTSPSSNTRKSVTAINLAIAMALDATQSVILLEADLRNPSFAEKMGIPDGTGMAEYLNSVDDDFRNYLLATNYNNLRILCSEKASIVSSEIFTSLKARRFMSELKGLPNTTVVCDLPPILVGDDVLAFSAYLDGILMVVEDGKTKTSDLEQALSLIKKTPIIGTVLNKH